MNAFSCKLEVVELELVHHSRILLSAQHHSMQSRQAIA